MHPFPVPAEQETAKRASVSGGLPALPDADLWRPAMLRSERLRAAALLVILMTFVGVVALVARLPGVFPAETVGRYRASLIPLSITLFMAAAYEAVVWGWIGRIIKAGASLPPAFRYVNALIETSVPAVIMGIWARAAGPVPALAGVLPWLYFPFVAASALHLSARLCLFTAFIAAVSFVAVARGLLGDAEAQDATGIALLISPISYLLKGVMILVGGFVAAFVAAQLRLHLGQAIQTALERDRAVSIFGQHVSPQVAQRLISQPVELAGELRHVCVMFFDIRGFSRMAAERTPAEVMGYLNTLFTPLIAIVNQHGGIVNKFLGDGFMAIFGAPFEDPMLERNAVGCASAMSQCVERLNAEGSIPETRIGIGIHAGMAVAGNVGSTERQEYTVLGDTVNVASRIEQATKEHQSRILVSEAVIHGLQGKKIQAEDIGSITLRGVPQPVRLFKLA